MTYPQPLFTEDIPHLRFDDVFVHETMTCFSKRIAFALIHPSLCLQTHGEPFESTSVL